jgi:aryl-alcohol dehydrogenase-like predicted oxidoreductase
MDFAEVKKAARCPATIGFRLSEEDGEVLAARAKTLGVSVHDLARFYTITAVRDREERVDLRGALEKLHQEMTELRKDVVISTEVLLSSAGKVEAEEARAWVDKTLSSS